MTVETETLLPEPSTSHDAVLAEVTIDFKGTEDILLEATAAVTAELPTSSSSDLFGGVLGEYELNEIPSLFLDTQQMSADLETLGFSTAAAVESTAEIPFITADSSSTSVGSATQVSATDSEGEANTNHNQGAPNAAQKRSAAEISEDEDANSQSSKVRRVSRSSYPITPIQAKPTPPEITPAPISPPQPAAANRRPLAPKPPARKVSVTSDAINASANPARKVDTSTAHVKALTGAKGAAMCFEIVSGTPQDTTVAIPNLACADLSPEEKAKFSRDRNRLHARNTRIRKKAYVDELKRTLEVLVQERDSAEAARGRKSQIEREERDVRFSVLEEFLRLRGMNEQVPTRWNAILEETVTLRLPNMELRGPAGAGAAAGKKLVSGVPELMKECNDFTHQMQAGKRGAKIINGYLNFQCDRTSLLMEGCSVVLDWTATSTDPARANMMMRGTCRATFNPQSNKLHAVELVFDSSPLMA